MNEKELIINLVEKLVPDCAQNREFLQYVKEHMDSYSRRRSTMQNCRGRARW